MFNCCKPDSTEELEINPPINKEYSEYLKNYITNKSKNPSKIYSKKYNLKPYEFDENSEINILKLGFYKFKNNEKQKILESFFKNLVNIKNYYPINKFPIYNFGDYIYQGNIEKGKKEGYGRIYYKDTELYYEGEWFDDKYHGQGLKINEDNSYEFGYFKKGILQGNNILISKSSGSIYNGDINDGEETGSAFIKYSKSDFYFGDVLNGKKSGYGTYKSLNKTEKGKFNEDKLKEGEIIFYDNDNNISKTVKGTFTYDKELNGLGTIQFTEFGSFEGNFKNGKKEGYGQLKTKSGRIYTGNWENDQLNGSGYFTKNGLTVEVKYENGKIVS